MVANPEDPLPSGELGERLAEVYGVVGPLYRRVLRLVEQVTPISVGVRAVLEHLTLAQPETVPDIARALALSRQFVQRSVNDALNQDFVVLRPNPAHRRSSLVEMTDTGRAAIGAVQTQEHMSLGQVGGDLTRKEVETTLRVLRHMLAAVDHINVDND